MTSWLKQSTAVTVLMGPFLDDTDLKTPRTNLVIDQVDIRLSKNGGDAAQSNNVAGALHDENGYYAVPLDVVDTNTLGSLKVMIDMAGALPISADFMVVPTYMYLPGAPGDSILTVNEAANVLRCADDDAEMLALLPIVDRYLINATGYDWRLDTTIREEAKSAARMLLVMWHENPGMVGQSESLSFGLAAALTQLEAIGLRYRKYVIFGRASAGVVSLPGARIGDVVEKLTGVYLVSGDQSAAFETVITVDDCIQQSSGSDLSDAKFVVVLRAAEDIDP